MTTPVLVAVAWPYASGSRHLGHLAGAYLPSDIFARQQRIIGNEVLMVSGSDVHGTPITVRADAEGVTPQDIVDQYHTEFLQQWERLGISWDLYTTTGTSNHSDVTQNMFLAQLERGHIDRRTSEQLFDEEVSRFLPDRYVKEPAPIAAQTKHEETNATTAEKPMMRLSSLTQNQKCHLRPQSHEKLNIFTSAIPTSTTLSKLFSVPKKDGGTM